MVVASMALIAMIASVAVPGPVGSRVPSPIETPSADTFATVEMVAAVRGQTMTIQPLDPGFRSDGNLDQGSTMFEPDTGANEPPQARSKAAQPAVAAESIRLDPWHLDRNVSWYGPGFYGKRTACGLTMTTTLVGVAHKTAPCGTLVAFRNAANGRVVTAPVVDRGPYVAGRQWDLTGGLCKMLSHCSTGSMYWKYPPD